MREKIKLKLAFIASIILCGVGYAQNPKVKIDKNISYQKITGFGGFVNSPQFSYNHMTTQEIQTSWGVNSEAGYNIMRLYIPENKNNWSSVVSTAQLAKSMGLTIFASPWTMPAEWKTNNHINAVHIDPDGVQQIGYLKPEHYQDYALYLNDFVTYLRDNGVELDYISVQNEPDEKALYHGCIWTPDQIATFVKDYGQLINCKVIAPESVGFSDNYANAFLKPEVMANFEVYAGHQYGGIQSVYKQFQNYNKQIWQTEYLINWNSSSSSTPRDFDWNIDGFSFSKSVNDALLGNINAWIHYATKRFYGLMGDGTYGSTTGVLTKRGRILQQLAKNVTGKTRINATWTDEGVLNGSSYISDDGNKIVLFVYNTGSTASTLTVDLPFYTISGTKTSTNATTDYITSNLTYNEQTFRPTVTVDASSVITFVFNKNSDRPQSNMVWEDVHYNKIDVQLTSNTAFGTAYKISGQTKTWSNSSPLFSSNTTATNGYVALDDRYNKLVMRVNSATSAGSRYSDNTTLRYVNAAGAVVTKNYGRVTFPASGSFDIVLDISTATLTDGIKGIISLTNSNFSSVLTMNFGDIYLNIGNEKTSKFSGVYSDGDSNLLDALESNYSTSLDLRDVTGIPSNKNWNQSSTNKNSIYYAPSSYTGLTTNVIANYNASTLLLTDKGGDFNVPFNFNATSATYTAVFAGYKILSLPFEATIPTGVTAYNMVSSATNVSCTSIKNGIIPANTAVLISANGTFTFTGNGAVTTPKKLTVANFVPVYISHKSPVKSYVFKTVNNVSGFYPVTTSSLLEMNPFTAYITAENSYSAEVLPLKFDITDDTDADGVPNAIDLCPDTPAGQTVNISGCAQGQLDDDGDGVKNSVDLCPNTPAGQTVNANGCAQGQLDDDGDGVKNDLDLCPNTVTGQTVNANGCAQEQLDDDGDGVKNNLDLCPNTPSGQAVDANGCIVLGSTNYSIEVVSESCPNKNNGQIIIKASQNLAYSAIVNGVAKAFNNKLLILNNLNPGTYDICIDASGTVSKQCYSIVVVASTAITAKTSSSSDKLHVEIASGTAPYQVNVNGVLQFETNNTNFDVAVNSGDVLEVTTSKLCEGSLTKTITLFDLVRAVPNPTSGPFDIYLPTNDSSVAIEIFKANGTLISQSVYPIENGKVHMDLSNQAAGIYFVKLRSNPVETIKIIKK
ncbi:thrombospondin type 3 repeat-containing protein [Flavobacterium seoulense]|uniref:Secretion protein n=1 Tax=Flavobacterium seoulense TaxID=1492738 RepID=A0A066WSN6_9FLAO|nr:thrombospondin type 3 repeat-containing protein [Flavobacterium seoulense]KDN53690.1 secretion protein [Flavobacterium seoulense]